MKSKGPSLLFATIVTLLLGAGAVLVIDARAQQARQAKAEEFQRLVGGLGLGPAVDLSGCAFSFDPRVCPHCSENLGPIPGGFYFCPQHACSIFYVRLEPHGREQDAQVP